MTSRTLIGAGDPERLRVAITSPSLGAVLKVPPAVGRWFTDAEGLPGGAAVAVLSHGLWTRRFGRDASVIGRSIILDGKPSEVVGVMPAGFAFPEPTVDLWVPAQQSAAEGFGYFGQSGVARLRDGVSLKRRARNYRGCSPGSRRPIPTIPKREPTSTPS